MKIANKFILLAFVSLMLVSCKTSQRAEILFETTKGNFTMALFNETPLHRDAYLVLTRCGYFDSLLFHRVIDNFVVQAGDPESRHACPGQMLGNGEPFRIPAEICFPKLYHKRGMVNAAREGDETNPDRESCGSQFAIMTCGPLTEAQIERGEKWVREGTKGKSELTKEMKDYYKKHGGSPHLDAQYTVFAEIIDGMNVVDSIQKVKVDKYDRPLEDVRIMRATVVKDYK